MAKSSKGTKKAKSATAKPGKKTTKRKQVKVATPSSAKKKTAKAPVKKAMPKKKTAVKRSLAKKAAVKPVTAKPKKKVIPAKKTRPKALPAKRSLPPDAELSEELVEKATNTKHSSNGQMTLPGSETPVKIEDPLKAFDKHAAEKAVTKGDPQHKLQFSQTNRKQIRPSGKKPLWRK